MQAILYNFVMLITRFHNYLLTLNNQYENSFTDKELHFLIIGAFGIALILILHPLFLWLSKSGHTMVITFFYVLTVILVLTFAIEIGQGYYGTGSVELGDVIYGIAGFLAFFIVFSFIRGIIHAIINYFRDDDDEPEWLNSDR